MCFAKSTKTFYASVLLRGEYVPVSRTASVYANGRTRRQARRNAYFKAIRIARKMVYAAIRDMRSRPAVSIPDNVQIPRQVDVPAAVPAAVVCEQPRVSPLSNLDQKIQAMRQLARIQVNQANENDRICTDRHRAAYAEMQRLTDDLCRANINYAFLTKIHRQSIKVQESLITRKDDFAVRDAAKILITDMCDECKMLEAARVAAANRVEQCYDDMVLSQRAVDKAYSVYEMVGKVIQNNNQ